MDDKKQKLLIEYLISSPDTFALCQGIVKKDYFDPEFRNSVNFVKEYYDRYNTTPTIDQIDAETGVKFKVRDITNDEIEYCSNEIEIFCRRKAIEKAILSSPELIEKGDYGTVEQTVKDAVMVSLNRNLGLRYFEDVDGRLNSMLDADPTISTGWKWVDELLFGGLSRKEMLLVSANSGGGKSITLANLGFNYIEAGYNVLYISLELSPEIIAQRYDTMYTGIGRKDWKHEVSTISTRVQAAGEREGVGILDIIQMPTATTSNDVRAYLKEFYLHYNMMPDLLILDYIDEMAPNEFVSADNVWEKDKRCATQLRQIGIDHNMIIATASQLNRSAVNATHQDHSQIAGGISKINVADVYWSIVMTDANRAAGEMIFNFQKTRNSDGVGKSLYMKWDGKFLRIFDQGGPSDDSPSGLTFNKKTKNDLLDFDENPSGGGLLDLMNNT